MFIYFRPRDPRRSGANLINIGGALGTITANTTNTTRYGGPTSKSVILKAGVSVDTVPVDADGTLMLTVYKYDSANAAEVALTTAFNLESLVTKKVTLLTLLSTLTDAQRTFLPGDTLLMKVVSNSAAIDTAATSAVLNVELAVIE